MPKPYKPAKGPSGKGNYGGKGQKPAKDASNKLVDKKVKKVLRRFKHVPQGPTVSNQSQIV